MFFKTIDFRQALLCCTYDDEVWSLVKLMLCIGDEESKQLASVLKGMNVDEAQAYIRENP